MGIPTRRDFLVYAKHEPRLLELEEKIQTHSSDTASHKLGYCANNVWFSRGGFKQEMMSLVGWKSDVPELNNSDAYDTVYQYLYHLLPDCNHDGGGFGCFQT